MDLEHQLRLRREQIITHYASYRSDVRKLIISKQEPVDDLVYFLKLLPGLGQFEGRLKSQEEEPSIRMVFDLIDEYSSYLHYEVFKSILDKFCPEEKDGDDFKYPEYLKDYIKKLDVKHFMMINPELEKLFDDKYLRLKIDIEETTNITKIKKLKSSIAAILGSELNPSKLILVDVKKGCLILTFLIPADVAEAIFAKKLSKDQIERLRSLSVLWLKYEDIEVDCRLLLLHIIDVGQGLTVLLQHGRITLNSAHPVIYNYEKSENLASYM